MVANFGGLDQKLVEAIEAHADTVVALCPCCQVQLRDSNIKNHLGLKISDLAHFTMEALMPNMLPLIIPYMTPKMMAYIKEEL